MSVHKERALSPTLRRRHPLYTKKEKPGNGLDDRPFQGFSRNLKGYVEKYPLTSTYFLQGKNFFRKFVTFARRR
jgi:hypothetical protein